MDYEQVKESLGPCGLCCETCFARVDGDIRSYSQKLKERLGGSIWCKRVLGQGTTFFFQRPRYQEQISGTGRQPADISTGSKPA
jgi:hypothetical protein